MFLQPTFRCLAADSLDPSTAWKSPKCALLKTPRPRMLESAPEHTLHISPPSSLRTGKSEPTSRTQPSTKSSGRCRRQNCTVGRWSGFRSLPKLVEGRDRIGSQGVVLPTLPAATCLKVASRGVKVKVDATSQKPGGFVLACGRVSSPCHEAVFGISLRKTPGWGAACAFLLGDVTGMDRGQGKHACKIAVHESESPCPESLNPYCKA